MRSREEIKRRTIRAAILFVVLGAVLGAGYLYSTKPRSESAEARALAAQAASVAPAAGCSGVRTIAPYPDGLDRTHVGSGSLPALPPLSSYPSVPPTSGPHDPVPLDAGEYVGAPPIGKAIHSLEHGAVIVWLSPEASDRSQQLAAFFEKPENREHVIVATYHYPDQGAAGELPRGIGMALVAWHRMQVCRDPSLPVAAAFVSRFAAPTEPLPLLHPRGYDGEAPEAGLPI